MSASKAIRLAWSSPAVLAAFSACSDPGNGWTDLTAGFRPSAIPADSWTAASSRVSISAADPSSGVRRIRVELPEDFWEYREAWSAWICVRPFRGNGLGRGGRSPVALHTENYGEHRWVGTIVPASAQGLLRPGDFATLGDTLAVHSGRDGPAPRGAVYEEAWCPGRSEDGSWVVWTRGMSGKGIQLLAGQTVEIACHPPPRSELRLSTVAVGHSSERATFRIRAGEELLLEHVQELRGVASPHPHRVALPSLATGSPLVLSFDVQGPLGTYSVFEPRLVPLQPDDGPRRPDIVLFIADTFRADNLAAYGGALAVTPELNALAESCVRFTSSWATSSWTLPSHASLFTGLYPDQVGMKTPRSRLAPGVATLAGTLRRMGYRTGAVTDGHFVSARYGLAAGFDTFDERRPGVVDTAERVEHFLEQSDGRPTFLVVQTYRAHWPYEGPGFEEPIGNEVAEFFEDFHARDERTDDPEHLLFAATLEARYRAASTATDGLVGRVLDVLEEHGLFDRGYLVFTSDHGEGFLEHGYLEHGNSAYGELLAVPLLVFGHDLAPADVTHPTSGVDVPATIVHLAGGVPPRTWPGRSLFELGPDHVVIGTESPRNGGPDALALMANDRKVIVEGDLSAPEWPPAVVRAYDLSRDANELDDVADRSAWPRQLLRANEAQIADATTRRSAALDAFVDPNTAKALRGLGYF